MSERPASPAQRPTASDATQPPRPSDSGPEAPRSPKPRWWSAPFRWLRKTASALLRPVRALVRPVRALVRSPFRLAKTVFMATIGRNRGFGFWWFIATLALAAAIGLVIAVVLSPVLGLLAAIGVGIWMLVRHSRSSDSDEAEIPNGRTQPDPGAAPRPRSAPRDPTPDPCSLSDAACASPV